MSNVIRPNIASWSPLLPDVSACQEEMSRLDARISSLKRRRNRVSAEMMAMCGKDPSGRIFGSSASVAEFPGRNHS